MPSLNIAKDHFNELEHQQEVQQPSLTHHAHLLGSYNVKQHTP
jgi:hypothetical protein